MKKSFPDTAVFIPLFISLFLVSAAVPAQAAPAKDDPFRALSDHHRGHALEYESRGELPKALLNWEIVNCLDPSDAEALRKIEALKSQTARIAEQHFKKGLSHYQRHALTSARKEFLLALSHDPGNKEALEYLKGKLAGEDFTLYEAKSGDTLRGIAQKTYHDPGKDFLIAFFNSIDGDDKLMPGSTLKLPVLQGKLFDQGLNIKDMVAKAQELFRSKQYQKALSIAEKISPGEHGDTDTRNLVNASFYEMGKTLNQEEKYLEALKLLSRIDPNYNDVKETIAFIKKRVSEKAQQHYVKGVKYFVNEQLDKAIREWEATLALTPDHRKAKEDIENARTLLRKLKKI